MFFSGSFLDSDFIFQSMVHFKFYISHSFVGFFVVVLLFYCRCCCFCYGYSIGLAPFVEKIMF